MNEKYECETLRYDPDVGWYWVFLQETNIKLKPFEPIKIVDIKEFVGQEDIHICDNCGGHVSYEMPSWRDKEYDAFTHHKRIAYKVIEGRAICINCISREWY